MPGSELPAIVLVTRLGISQSCMSLIPAVDDDEVKKTLATYIFAGRMRIIYIMQNLKNKSDHRPAKENGNTKTNEAQGYLELKQDYVGTFRY